MNQPELRQTIIAAALEMAGLGLNQGTAGNISARSEGPDEDGILLTPSGVPYDQLSPDHIIAMDWEGAWSAGIDGLKPTSEWRFHLDIMKARDDIGGIVHAHPPFATALACLRRDIPAFHYMVAVAGGAVIKCSEYATFGSGDLSAVAINALGDRNACLLANHGIIACGETVDKALALAVEVEALAGQYMRALQVGEPVLLDDAEMARVLEKFKAGYGYASEGDEG